MAPQPSIQVSESIMQGRAIVSFWETLFSMPVLIQLWFCEVKTVPLSFGVQILYKSMGSNELACWLPVIYFHQIPHAQYNPDCSSLGLRSYFMASLLPLFGTIQKHHHVVKVESTWWSMGTLKWSLLIFSRCGFYDDTFTISSEGQSAKEPGHLKSTDSCVYCLVSPWHLARC